MGNGIIFKIRNQMNGVPCRFDAQDHRNVWSQAGDPLAAGFDRKND
jgi:hypothetical protein